MSEKQITSDDAVLYKMLLIFSVALASLGLVQSVTVSIEQGMLLGQEVDLVTGLGTYHSFKGIPYAKPPLGNLRFKDPQEPEPWTGVRNATVHGSTCPQYNPITSTLSPGSEDCLFLNVYTRNLQPVTPLPVIVLVHSGIQRFQSGDDSIYGPDFIVEQNVVFVTFNYRLDALGFLNLDNEDVPGNAGLKDQIFALRWVKKNIANFGGDPGNVTILGHVSGGACASLYLFSPMATGLFNRIIMMSGSALSEWNEEFQSNRRAFELGRQLGINTTDSHELVQFLRNVSAVDLIHHELSLVSFEENIDILGKTSFFVPSVEKDYGQERFLTEKVSTLLKKGNVINDVDIIAGHNSFEFIIMIGLFYDQWIPLYQTWPEMFLPRNILYSADQQTILNLSDKIRQFYFGNKTLSWNTVKEFTRYLSDTSMGVDVLRFVQNLPVSNHKRFAYLLSLESERNLFGLQGLAYNITGMSHADDLFYLFDPKSYNLSIDISSEEYKMIVQFVSLFTNFAKYGHPTPDSSLGVVWPEYNLQSRSYMNISDQLTVGNNFEKETEEFWQSIYEAAGIDYYFNRSMHLGIFTSYIEY